MNDHKLGEQVLKNDKAGGKQSESVIDMAKNAWGDLPPMANRAAEPFLTKNDSGQSAQHAEKTAVADRTTVGDKSHHPTHKEQLAEASHRIGVLNKELHKPGGALAGSDLDLVGFDNKGRLLMAHHDAHGKLDAKYLVDAHSGKIVARTSHNKLDKWEKSPDYEKSNDTHHTQIKNGDAVQRDKHGHVVAISDGHGDKREIHRDQKTGEPNEIILTQKGKPSEHYHRNGQGADAVWMKQPTGSAKDAAICKFDVKEDGTIIQRTSEKDSVEYKTDGSIVEHHGNAQKILRQAAAPEHKGAKATAKPLQPLPYDSNPGLA